MPEGSRASRHALRLAVVVPLLDEAEHLPTFLASLDAQRARPTIAVLVDDGSSDGSVELAREFAADRDWVLALRRPRRPPTDDRLVDAPELRAFTWGLDHVETSWDVVVKLDADLDLDPGLFEAVLERFRLEPDLGVTGSVLRVRVPDGGLRVEEHPVEHVRGPNKFWRRRCYDDIAPLPEILGWDTVDEIRARAAGWRAESFDPAGRGTVHLRPTGLHDGRLRAFRRWGRCAWGYGADPVVVLAGAVRRARRPPRVVGGLSYLLGWANAGIRRYPRAEPETRAFARAEGRARLRAELRALGRGSS